MAALAEPIALEHLSFAGLYMPVTIRLPEPMSDVELIDFSRRVRPYQVERNADGELDIFPPLGLMGGNREVRVASALYGWTEEHGGVSLGPGVGYTLADKAVRSPDASWLSEHRLNRLTDEDGFVPFCPEFLIEILPKRDLRTALESRMEMWMANGAQLAWMIDPFAATLSIYRPDSSPEVLAHPDWVEAATVVPGFRLETSRLWAR